MSHPQLPAAISALDRVPPSFLDPSTRLLVISQDAERELVDACQALDAVAGILDSLDNANASLAYAGQCAQTVDISPESLSSLLRLVADKIKPHTDNPLLETVSHIRPDIFNPQRGGDQ